MLASLDFSNLTGARDAIRHTLHEQSSLPWTFSKSEQMVPLVGLLMVRFGSVQALYPRTITMIYLSNQIVSNKFYGSINQF